MNSLIDSFTMLNINTYNFYNVNYSKFLDTILYFLNIFIYNKIKIVYLLLFMIRKVKFIFSPN